MLLLNLRCANVYSNTIAHLLAAVGTRIRNLPAKQLCGRLRIAAASSRDASSGGGPRGCSMDNVREFNGSTGHVHVRASAASFNAGGSAAAAAAARVAAPPQALPDTQP